MLRANATATTATTMTTCREGVPWASLPGRCVVGELKIALYVGFGSRQGPLFDTAPSLIAFVCRMRRPFCLPLQDAASEDATAASRAEWLADRARERLREVLLRGEPSRYPFLYPGDNLYPIPHPAASRQDHVFVVPFDHFTQWAAESEAFGEESENLNHLLDMLGVKEAFPLRVASRRFSRYIGGTTHWSFDKTLRVLTRALRAGRLREESVMNRTTNELAVLRTVIAYRRQVMPCPQVLVQDLGFPATGELLQFQPPGDELDVV